MNKVNSNLAKGRYLAAKSTKKDAADILIIMSIYSILSLTSASVILITCDHFGEALSEVLSPYFPHRLESVRKKNLN